MTHRQLYAEACRKEFEGYALPDTYHWRKEGRRFPSHIPKNPDRRWSRADAEKLVEYCRQGLRSFDIAPLMGKTPKAIQKAFVRFGFPRLHNICPPRGDNNPAWKGGVHIGKFGYRFLRRPEHPYANHAGYVFEHRLVVEEHLGRFLDPKEVVHHIDGNHANNDISNLEVFSSNGEHLRSTLTGIRHNISPEGLKKLSEKQKALWNDPVMRLRMSTKRKQKPNLRRRSRRVSSIRPALGNGACQYIQDELRLQE